MKKLPLYFSQTYTLEGEIPKAMKAVLVKVSIDGRCIQVEDSSRSLGARFLFLGVNPGSVAGAGETLEAARADFFDAIGGVIQELAAEADSHEGFRALLKGFVEEVNRPELQDWVRLRQEVRTGSVAEPDFAKEKADRLPRYVLDIYFRDLPANDNFPAPELPQLEIIDRSELKLAVNQ